MYTFEISSACFYICHFRDRIHAAKVELLNLKIAFRIPIDIRTEYVAGLTRDKGQNPLQLIVLDMISTFNCTMLVSIQRDID